MTFCQFGEGALVSQAEKPAGNLLKPARGTAKVGYG
jgi:hypothetical protein